jgi:rod shape-determining protein MreB
MLRYFTRRSIREVCHCIPGCHHVPSGITGVEQSRQEAAEFAGARKPAYIIEEPMAAAIGAGLQCRSRPAT